MFCGFPNFIHLMFFIVMLAGVPTETVRGPSPKLEIIRKENYLHFHASPPASFPHCWKYMFQYSKCSEKHLTVNTTEDYEWKAKVEYDAACRYGVQVQAQYNTKYCGDDEQDSDMSKPVYFGQDRDPDLPFKVCIIIIPVLVCFCLIVTIVLFRRYKDKILPKIPSPSDYFKDMFDSSQEMKKGLYVGDVYVPVEKVVEEIHVEPKTTDMHYRF